MDAGDCEGDHEMPSKAARKSNWSIQEVMVAVASRGAGIARAVLMECEVWRVSLVCAEMASNGEQVVPDELPSSEKRRRARTK